MAKFQTGDIAVLKHISGARLFEVYSDDGEWVTEKSGWDDPEQQKFALRVRYHELVKVPDRKTAEFIVEETRRAYDAYNMEAQRLKRGFEGTCRQLFETFGSK